jgi:hypothetical protein
MPTFNVHIYREMRLTFSGIDAPDHSQAAEIARQQSTEDADSLDDCEGETMAALVDVAGDETHEQSQLVEFPNERRDRLDRAALIVLNLVRLGLAEIYDTELQFQGSTYAFNHNAPDWTTVVENIGWETALEALAQFALADHTDFVSLRDSGQKRSG